MDVGRLEGVDGAEAEEEDGTEGVDAEVGMEVDPEERRLFVDTLLWAWETLEEEDAGEEGVEEDEEAVESYTGEVEELAISEGLKIEEDEEVEKERTSVSWPSTGETNREEVERTRVGSEEVEVEVEEAEPEKAERGRMFPFTRGCDIGPPIPTKHVPRRCPRRA